MAFLLSFILTFYYFPNIEEYCFFKILHVFATPVIIPTPIVKSC